MSISEAGSVAPTRYLSATDLASAVRRRVVSAEEVVRAHVERIGRLDGAVRSFVYFDGEQALRAAKLVDEKIARGEPVGKLAGVPIGIKDIFNTRDMPTQMGSPIWMNFWPGNDARVVHDLRMADAVIAGKTVTAEFAVHAPGLTRNPRDLARSPGTSSSGSAAAVAMSLVQLALGTQTAGSIIRPASYCGVYGFKPSFGLIPRTGVLKTTDTLDTIGMFANSADDLQLLLGVIRAKGRDFPLVQERLWERMARHETERWNVGLVIGPKWPYAEEYAQKEILRFANSMGVADAFELPPEFALAHRVHGRIYDKTLAYYFREEFKQHTLVSPLMYEIIERGSKISLDEYKDALRVQRELSTTIDQFFERYDVLLDLSTGGDAPLFGESDRPDNCLIWTLCGLPTINVPLFASPDGLPYGLQAIGRRFSDYRLLRFVNGL